MRKVDGFWKDFENIRALLAPIVARLGRMPKSSELKNPEFNQLRQAIDKNFGGLEAVRIRLGLPEPNDGRRKPNEHWKAIENVSAMLAPIVAEIGGMPTPDELRSRGLGGAGQGILKYHGGFTKLRTLLGIPKKTKPNSVAFFGDIANVKATLIPIVAELGRMPMHKELVARNLYSLSKAINARHGGIEAVIACLRQADDGAEIVCGNHGGGFWKKFENIERVLRPIVAELGRMPDSNEMRTRAHPSVLSSIYMYHGSLAAVAARLGLAPIDDAAFAARADALIPVVLALGISDTGPLWTAAKKRWTTARLDAALAAFAADGSLDAFRALLADP